MNFVNYKRYSPHGYIYGGGRGRLGVGGLRLSRIKLNPSRMASSIAIGHRSFFLRIAKYKLDHSPPPSTALKIERIKIVKKGVYGYRLGAPPARFPTESTQRATDHRLVGRKVSIHYRRGVKTVICNSESVRKYTPKFRKYR